jgi:hypothetical protein
MSSWRREGLADVVSKSAGPLGGAEADVGCGHLGLEGFVLALTELIAD